MFFVYHIVNPIVSSRKGTFGAVYFLFFKMEWKRTCEEDIDVVDLDEYDEPKHRLSKKKAPSKSGLDDKDSAGTTTSLVVVRPWPC